MCVTVVADAMSVLQLRLGLVCIVILQELLLTQHAANGTGIDVVSAEAAIEFSLRKLR